MWLSLSLVHTLFVTFVYTAFFSKKPVTILSHVLVFHCNGTFVAERLFICFCLFLSLYISLNEFFSVFFSVDLNFEYRWGCTSAGVFFYDNFICNKYLTISSISSNGIHNKSSMNRFCFCNEKPTDFNDITEISCELSHLMKQ